MSSTHRLFAQRMLALYRTCSSRVPSAIQNSRLTNAYTFYALSCRRYLSAFADSPAPAASSASSSDPFPAQSTGDAAAHSTASAADSTAPVDSRWSHLLDPANPPKLTVAHYALLSQIPNSRADAAAASQPPTSATPGLDHAIGALQRMIASLGQQDAKVRQEIIAMQQQLAEPPVPSASEAAEASEGLSFFNPTTKLKCRFCSLRRLHHTHNPQYAITPTNVALLHQFINLRGMLYARRLTGNCGRHQRQVAYAVKRARLMGLLSFTSNWRLPDGWADVERAGGGGLGLGDGEVEGEVLGRGVEARELSFVEELDESKVDEEDDDDDDVDNAYNKR